MASLSSQQKKQLMMITLVVVVLSAVVLATMIQWGPSVPPIPELIMTNSFGDEVRLSETDGTIRLLTFIYIHCPDICPATTANQFFLQKRLQEAGYFGKEVQFITITMDPERDTPKQLHQYAQNFNVDFQGWSFWSGTEAETEKALQAFNFYAQDQGEGYYLHSTKMYLLDQERKVVKIYGMADEMDLDVIYLDMLQLVSK
ncbi:SCO family protein [Rubeoparvulum massiliense]|uniref:SCO family protein n=1 Tax=Rubeoparvulum massiliense TaxID=1631346 RepID=UPI00065DF9A1|nr:SCO family protein [Rubeoparvulum massiliense]